MNLGLYAITTYSAYAMSEYNQVYIKLIYNAMSWKLAALCPLTDKIKSFMLSQGLDRA